MSTLTNANASASINWTLTQNSETGVAVPYSDVASSNLSLTPGTGANGTGNLQYSAVVAIPASTSQDFKLTGTLLDVFNELVSFTRVKFFSVVVFSSSRDTDSTGGPVSIGGAGVAGNAWVGWISDADATIKVGGTAGRQSMFELACEDSVAMPVIAGTGDVLRVTNLHPANPVVVQVTFIGSTG